MVKSTHFAHFIISTLALFVFAVPQVSGQSLEMPAQNTVRPNIMGPISKVLSFVPRNYAPEHRFALGMNGLFSLNPEVSVGEDLLRNKHLQFRTPKGYTRKEDEYLPFSPVDVVETGIGHFIASDAGVFYSPYDDNRAFTQWSTTGNPELLGTDLQSERYSLFCGDNVTNPPVNISSVARASEEDVVIASSPDGVFRLKVFDYTDPKGHPTFCWNRIKELANANIQYVHYVGERGSNSVWFMSSAAGVYRVEANPRSYNSKVEVTDITSLLRDSVDEKTKPIGGVLKTIYDPRQMAIAIIFDDGIYSYDLKFGRPGYSFDESTIVNAHRLIAPGEVKLSSLYAGYYSLGEKVAFSSDKVFLATPTSVKVFSRSGAAISAFSTPFLTPPYEDVFITSIGTIYTKSNTSSSPDVFNVGLSSGGLLEYNIGDLLSAKSATNVKLRRNLATVVTPAPGTLLAGPKVVLGGFEYVQDSNPPCVASKTDRQQKEVVDGIKAILASVETTNPLPIFVYVSRFVTGILPRKSQLYSEIRNTLYGEGGNANCAYIVSLPFAGDLHGKIKKLELLTYDIADSAPVDDSGKLNEKENSETCPDKSPGCDSHVGWARWYTPVADKQGIISVTKDGKTVSMVLLVFKNWSADRVRGAQINLVVN